MRFNLKLGEVFGGGYVVAGTIDHPLVEEIRCNAQGDGANVSSDPNNLSGRSGYLTAGAVEIAEGVLRQIEIEGLLFAFT